MPDDLADGSSINDDSEGALVPDVGPLPSPVAEISSEVDDPTSSNEMLLIDLPNNIPVSFEDAAEYDFVDFDGGLGAKMPALCAIDDDAMFGESKNMGKTLYGDISWESVVPENIEHVVPDVSEPTSTGRPRRESADIDGTGNGPKVVVSAPSCGRDTKVCKEKLRMTKVVHRSTNDFKVEDSAFVKHESSICTSASGRSIVGKKRAREPNEEKSELPSVSSSEIRIGDQDAEAEKDEEARHAELRKKRRMEALARFRSKRANRSFTKRVRYECRKQLADSRPRVKGRFVRKIEMALFRKYGALYREHLDELTQPQAKTEAGIVAESESKPQSGSDQRVPAL